MQVMVGNYGSYTFDAATGVITVSGMTLQPGQLKMIVNAKTNTLIFNLADQVQTAVVSGNTITLAYNTSGMSNSDPLQIFLDVPADLVPQAVVGTFWQATQPVSGTVAVSNLPVTQPVSGTFWQTTQPISGTVDVANFPATQPVSGSVSVSNLPSTQAVSGTVAISNSSLAVTGTFWQTTQPISGTVAVSGTVPVSGTFWQTTQPVSWSGQSVSVTGSVAVTGTFWQATQPVSGSVSVSNFPSTQAVTGTFWQTTQPVSGTVTADISGSINNTEFGANQGTANTADNAWPVYATVSGSAIDPRSIRALTSSDQVTLANSSIAVTGTFWQTTQPVSWSGQSVTVTGSVAVTGTFWQATQPVSGTVTAQLQDGSGNSISSTSGSLNVNVTGGASNTQYADNATVSTPTGTVMLGQYVATNTVQAIQTDVNGNLMTVASSLDGTVLDTQSAIVATGPGSTYTVKGYGFISFQFGGQWAGGIRVEGSNDGISWTQLYVQHLGDGYITDITTIPAVVLAESATVYMRYNVVSLQTGTITATVVGNTGTIPTTSLLAMSFDATSGVQQNVNVLNLKTDTIGGLLTSDAPLPIIISGGVGQNIIVDTQGYDSLNITTEALTANVTTSNDKVTWSTLSGVPLAMGGYATALVANTGYSFPCIARFIRFAVTAAGNATAYLRSAPWTGTYTTSVPTATASNNLAQIGATTVVSGGVAGTLAVGGNVAVGVAQTNNPIVIGGIDTGNLTRRLQTDTSGRPNINAMSTDQTATVRNLGSVSPGSNMQNIPALAVMDVAQFEGQSIAELLAQILIELRISNYYNFNLPTLLTTGTTNSASDEPASLRNDPVIATVFG